MTLVLTVVGVALVAGGLVVAFRGIADGTARRRRPWSDPTTSGLAWAAVAWTVLTGAVLLLTPLVTTESVSSGAAPSSVGAGGQSGPSGPTGPAGPQGPGSRPQEEVRSTTTRETLLEHEGASVVVLVLVPVAVALAGALGDGRTARWRRITVGWVLVAACLVGSASLGLFYVPAAVALLTAGVKTRARGGASPLDR